MPNLKDIRKRIGSVKNTQKITRAMKLVAAARLRRAQQDILELRPYAVKTHEMLSMVSARTAEESEVHPLLEKRAPKQVLLIVLTSDRGLAGAFNASITREAMKQWKKFEAEGAEVSFAVIGRKGRDFLKRRGANIDRDFMGIFEDLTMENAGEIGRYIVNKYAPNLEADEKRQQLEGGALEYTIKDSDLDAAYLIYNEFKSAIAQDLVVEPLLPITPADSGEEYMGDFLYEPNQGAVLSQLLRMYVQVEVFRALLESVASEHGARMTAMDAATNNAGDMIDRLTLQFNRARQAAITKELMEIIGGAEALKG